MKRALTDKQIAEIERRAKHEPIEGTYAAMSRSDYPALKSVVTEASGACAVDAVKRARDKAREEGNEELARVWERWLAANAIPESELIQ